VLLDEPFSALDAALRTSLRDEVAATLRATGTTAVLVTHDQAEALAVADQVAVMRDGAIVQVGSPVEVYLRPVDAWTARFVGDLVELPGSTSERVRACRPEQLVRSELERAPFAGPVRSVRFGGPDALLAIEVDGRTLTARWPSIDLPAVGEVVGLTVAGEVLDLPTEPAARAVEPD
jgi:iron(III) transport system ATP-binding protein